MNYSHNAHDAHNAHELTAQEHHDSMEQWFSEIDNAITVLSKEDNEEKKKKYKGILRDNWDINTDQETDDEIIEYLTLIKNNKLGQMKEEHQKLDALKDGINRAELASNVPEVYPEPKLKHAISYTSDGKSIHKSAVDISSNEQQLMIGTIAETPVPVGKQFIHSPLFDNTGRVYDRPEGNSYETLQNLFNKVIDHSNVPAAAPAAVPAAVPAADPAAEPAAVAVAGAQTTTTRRSKSSSSKRRKYL